MDKPIESEFLKNRKQQQIKVLVVNRPYLRKRNSCVVLPCQRKIIEQSKNIQFKNDKTSKAQIYQRIHQKNIEKFGQKTTNIILSQKKKKKKIHPNNMTVNYKPKNKKIQLEQIKHLKYIPLKKKQSQQISQKKKYEKLLQIFQGEIIKLTQQKTQFQKVAESLKFKAQIKSIQPLPITKKRNKLQQKMINTINQQLKINCINKTSQIKNTYQNNSNSEIQKDLPQHKKLDCDQIRKILREAQNKKQQIVSKNKQYFECEGISLKNVHTLPQPDIESLTPYINNLVYSSDDYYKTALAHTENRLKKTLNIKTKYIGVQRVIKYQDEWVEVWTPGHQRLMSLRDQFKVIWFTNGDIRLEFQSKIWVEYSAKKDIQQIHFINGKTIGLHLKTKTLF